MHRRIMRLLHDVLIQDDIGRRLRTATDAYHCRQVTTCCLARHVG